jgi:GDP-mannose 6-dehydrogenase
MRISIFGLGYVGCVSLGCLAKNGHHVVGVDLSQLKVDIINSGHPTIIEKEMDEIIHEQWEKNKIAATTDYLKAVKETELSFICVGTPPTVYGHLNLEYIFNSAEQIALGIKEKNSFHIIVIRSTVLPGTNEKIGDLIEKITGKKRNIAFAVVSNPEFLREGSAVEDYYNPPLTVLGSDNTVAIEALSEIYEPVNGPIEVVDIKIAELIKYVNNSYHALKVTFANEIGNICKKLDIDSHDLMRIFCMDTQLNISPYYFSPGFAYGGSCLPKDMKALKTLAHDMYLNTPVLNSIEHSNEEQKNIAYDLIVSTGKNKIGVLGLSFKPDTDDLRYSPIVYVVEKLIGKGFKVGLYDKNVMKALLVGSNKEFAEQHLPHLFSLLKKTAEEVIEDAEVIVITNKDITFSGISGKYPEKLFIDLARVDKQRSMDNYTGICW